METMYYIGLDVHKKTIDHCVKDGSGRIYVAGSIPATRLALDMWMKTLPRPVDSGHGSDHLHGLDLRSSPAAYRSSKVVHPLMLRAIAVVPTENSVRTELVAFERASL